MPHLRTRHVAARVKKLASLWPAVGLIGPRQSGKTTLLRELLGVENVVSFDDIERRTEAARSPKLFLSRLNLPVVIDEAQKAPEVFDALKLRIDAKRVPGQYYLTGSSSFSLKAGVKESLTGRLGLVHLSPMTVAELKGKPFSPVKDLAAPQRTHAKPRFDMDTVGRAVFSGGMPVPAFFRSEDQRRAYWQSWLETTLYRDLARLIPRQYDPDLALNMLNRMALVMRDGELPTLKHFQQPARKVRAYLFAMEEIFLVRKISCHPSGVGKEVWIFFDSGLPAYLMGTARGEGGSLSLARHFLWNEWLVQAELQGLPFEKLYYKTAHGHPVDGVIGGVPFRVVATTVGISTQAAWEERPLIGAMRKLGSKFGYLIGPTDHVTLPGKNGGVGILPWGIWG